MSLIDWQIGLGRLVAHCASAGPDEVSVDEVLVGLALSPTERTSLRRMVPTPGFAVTTSIQARWRRLRLRIATPLSMAALGRELADEALAAFCRQTMLRSLFFATEAVQFLQLVSERFAPTAQIRCIVDFERSLLRANNASPTPRVPDGDDDRDHVRRSPGANIVVFPCPAELLLGSLLTRAPSWPDVDGPHPVLVSPGLPTRWRPATDDESAVLSAAIRPIELAFLRRLSSPAVDTLIEAGALTTP